MGKFMSIPGMTHNGERQWRDAPVHPGAKEFYANRDTTSHESTGFEAGEEIYHRGEPGVVLHEQKNSRGEVEVVYRVSRRGDAAVYKSVWAPDQARSMVLRDVRRTDDYE